MTTQSQRKKYSKDGKVCFNAGNHTYWFGKKRLESVTRLISKYKQPFDTDRIAEAYAKKHGLDKDEVIKEWELKGLESRERGTACHNKIESYLIDGVVFSPDNEQEESAIKFIDNFISSGRLKVKEVECIVYNQKYAGQVDLICENEKGEYFMFDWKTNKTIDLENKWQNMLDPLSKYHDCNYNHYSLQLNIYKSMCDYLIKDSFIIHLSSDYQLYKTNNINLQL